MKNIPEEHGCDYMLPLEVQQPEYSGVHTPLDSCSRSTDILAKGAASSRVVPRVLRLGPIATMGRAGWRTASWMASGDGYLLDGRRASMLLRAEEQFGRAEERRVSFTDDKWRSPRMRHGAYCPVGGPGCPEPTSVLQAADSSVRS